MVGRPLGASATMASAHPLAVNMVLPAAAPLALPVVVAGVAGMLRNMKKQSEEREAFYNMDWADAAETDGEDGCILIGEEAADDGKQWFVCTESTSGDCEVIAEYGSPGMTASDPAEESYLCKQPKVV